MLNLHTIEFKFMKFLYSSVFFLALLHPSLQAQSIQVLQDDGSYFDASNLKGVTAHKGEAMMGCPAAANLVTFYNTNNAQRGHMFDINGTNGVTILCFEMNFAVGTTDVDIYTKVGTHVGFESTPAAWTLVGSAAGVVSAGPNVATSIPIAVNQNIPVGTTRAFYITRTTVGGPVVDYTNGTGVGNLLASDANIIIREGTGKEYLFSTNFSPRQFNGRVFYNLLAVLPVEFTDFTATYNNRTVDISWITASETNSDYFAIERSNNGIDFEELKKVKAAGNSNTTKNYGETDNSPLPGLSYYRIKYFNLDGTFSYTYLRSVSPKYNAATDIVVTPVPAQNFLNLGFNSNGPVNFSIEIFDVTGKAIYKNSISAENGFNQTGVDVSELNKGLYFIKLNGNNDHLQARFIKE